MELPLAFVFRGGVLAALVMTACDEHHIVFIVRGVMRGLVCRDTKGRVYTEAQARAMYAACKTLALKP